jgi:hypothetical protein
MPVEVFVPQNAILKVTNHRKLHLLQEGAGVYSLYVHRLQLVCYMLLHKAPLPGAVCVLINNHIVINVNFTI